MGKDAGADDLARRVVELAAKRGFILDAAALSLVMEARSRADPLKLVEEAARLAGSRGGGPFLMREAIQEILKSVEQPAPMPYTGPTEFKPLAKEFESDLGILLNIERVEEASDQAEARRAYLVDRFRKIEKILRARMDVSNLRSLSDAKKSTERVRVKVIAMVSEVRGRTLQAEDPASTALVIIPRKAPAPLTAKARLLHIDLVACLEVLPIGGRLVLTDIIFPDVPEVRGNRSAEPLSAILTSDLHVGSRYFMEKAFLRLTRWLRGEWGDEAQRRLASQVKYLVVAGDLVDGVGVYPRQEAELSIKNVQEQYRRAWQLLRDFPDYVEIVAIPGNHDATRRAMPQPPIAAEFSEQAKELNVTLLSNPSAISLHGVHLLLTHGASIEDLVASVPGFGYNQPQLAMEHLLRVRHLAPIYGGRTQVGAEGEDMLVVTERPDVLHSGHVHVYGASRYRGVAVVNSGAWQGVTSYQRTLGVNPTPGILPVLHLNTLEVETVSMLGE